MKNRMLIVMALAMLAPCCTRENADYDPTMADGGFGPRGQDGWTAPPVRDDTTPTPPTTPRCGDGQCQPGESPATCPGDCQPCPAGATACAGKDSIRYCKDGAWRTDSCQAVCAADNYHYAVECRYAPNLAKEACICGRHARFGELCDDAQVRCAPGLFCGMFSGSKIGFCTRHCAPPGASCGGAPPGTAATCSLTSNGKNACGFICPFGTLCPMSLTCDIFSGICKP